MLPEVLVFHPFSKYSASSSVRGLTPITMPPSLIPRSYSRARSSGMPEPTSAPTSPPVSPPAPAPASPAASGPATMRPKPGRITLVPMAAIAASTAPTVPPMALPDGDAREQELLREVMRPFPAEEMVGYPVSTLVNSPRNKGSELIEEYQLNSA